MTDITKTTPLLVSSPNYGKLSRWDKARRKLRSIILSKIANTSLQFKLYPAYWHSRLSKVNGNYDEMLKSHMYLTQKPNFGAGIGHQLANWNSGLHFSIILGLKYAHSGFSTEKWENFFGFGEGEVLASDLEKDNQYKKVLLPRFDSTNSDQINIIREIVHSYAGQKVLFNFELDQGYMRQCDTSKILSEKFFNARSRTSDKLIFSKDSYNVAIHIRRRMKIETEEVWKSRGLDNQYFATVLEQVLNVLSDTKKVTVYLFSQGRVNEFPEFMRFENVIYCVDMGPIESVLHMINADLLISSKSSFSYKPALISKNLQIAPRTFWHDYPDNEQYILADNAGNFDNSKLKRNII